MTYAFYARYQLGLALWLACKCRYYSVSYQGSSNLDQSIGRSSDSGPLTCIVALPAFKLVSSLRFLHDLSEVLLIAAIMIDN
jgi:hypothetical protein